MLVSHCRGLEEFVKIFRVINISRGVRAQVMMAHRVTHTHTHTVPARSRGGGTTAARKLRTCRMAWDQPWVVKDHGTVEGVS